MNRVRGVHHDARGFQRNRSGYIEGIAGSGVPSTFKHGDVPSVGVRMRAVHDVRRKLGANHIDAGLARIAQQNCLLGAMPIGNVLPVHIRRRDPDELRLIHGGTR